MDIPIPKELEGEHSQQDALFQIQSQLLQPQKSSKQQNKYRISYKKSFQPILAQTLLKKTLNVSWKQRYFLLTSTRLLYYSDATMQELKGCFILASLVQHKLSIKFTPPQICLTVRTGGEVESEKTLLLLKTENSNVFKEWERELNKVLLRLQILTPEDLALFPKIKPENLLDNNSKLGISEGNFWNRLIISIPELMKYGSHMDIILMRSKNPIFYLHRFLMRSHFDHVGVLVKDETERLFVLEAIQSKGVCLSSLDSVLLTFHEEYEELAYRKLIVQGNTSLHIEHLESYINNILGSKYELSLTKLLLDNTVDYAGKEGESLNDKEKTAKEEKTYFCSQLVADIYLKFGILAQGRSNNFWPKDFEEDQLALAKDFRLSPLMRVQLEEAPDSSEVSSN